MHDGLREHLQLEELTDESNVVEGTLTVPHLTSLKVFLKPFLLLSLKEICGVNFIICLNKVTQYTLTNVFCAILNSYMQAFSIFATEVQTLFMLYILVYAKSMTLCYLPQLIPNLSRVLVGDGRPSYFTTTHKIIGV